MNVVFADTSFYIALLQRSGPMHKRAIEITDAYRGRIVTTGWVLHELGNFLSPVPSRRSFLTLIETLRESPSVSIIEPHSRHFDTGLQLYSKRLDKAWFFVDCISFLVMQQHGITEALTADHHFVQAGFKALMI